MHKSYYEWTLDQWLYNLESRYKKEIHLGLSRIAKVAQQLKLLTLTSKIITVGGTNGKGSTVKALETLYHTAGYRVGSYTSPHLIHFNERIKVNAQPITDKELCLAFCTIEEARGETPLTYFEMATLAALYYFSKQSLDLIILEVGIGGRLDATNIIDSDLAIITSIHYDHQEFLGSTLDAIGYEKAGILRANKPFIYADTDIPSTVQMQASELAVESFIYESDFSIQEEDDCWKLTSAQHCIDKLPKPAIQLKSAAAALMATVIMQADLPITQDQMRHALTKMVIPGRLQLVVMNKSLEEEVNVLFDVAHNAQSVDLLAKTVKPYQSRTIHAVFSALKDKDILGLIRPLKDYIDCWYPAELSNKRATSMDKLLSFFNKAEISVNICYNSPLSAFQAALNNANNGDLIVVYGSFYTVGQIMAAQQEML